MSIKIIPKNLQQYFTKYLNIDNERLLIVKTTKTFNIKNYNELELIVNIEKTNNFRYVNKFHENVNNVLITGGIYCSCAETLKQRKVRKENKYYFLFKHIMLFIDFIYKRVLPKLPFIKKIYFMLTRGHNRVMTKIELIGRLISCGFEIIEIIEIDGLSYIFSKKIREPYFDMYPSYGPIFKMKRVGLQGKIISVYKFRTMSPYSEYTQKQVIADNKLDLGGKVKDDYRITFYGKFLRRYWIDEFPMIINWIKKV